LIAFAQCTLLLDSFLKQKHEKDEVEAGGKESSSSSAQNEEIIFSIYNIENWIVMAPLTIILGIIMVWCFYFRFMKAVMARKRLIWVEVLDQKNSEYVVSRY